MFYLNFKCTILCKYEIKILILILNMKTQVHGRQPGERPGNNNSSSLCFTSCWFYKISTCGSSSISVDGGSTSDSFSFAVSILGFALPFPTFLSFFAIVSASTLVWKKISISIFLI